MEDNVYETDTGNTGVLSNMNTHDNASVFKTTIKNTSIQFTLIYPSIADTSYNQYTNVLLIDNTVPSYQTFVDSANSVTFPIVYSKDCSGTELVELLRNRFSTIPRVGFVFTSTGNQSVTFLDNQPLFTDNYNDSTNAQLIVSIIREFSVINVDFLACDTLKYTIWKTYYEFLNQSTGVIVGASDDKTGNIKYGGDWILESTSEDIETIYFTQSIEYYQYLLDNLTWATLTYNTIGLATDGTYLYTGSNATPFYIGKIPISNASTSLQNWVSQGTFTTSNPSNNPNGVWGLAVSGNYLYVANNNTNTISKISLLTPSTDFLMNWVTNASHQLVSLAQITTYGNYLYCGVSRSGVHSITKISLTNPNTDYSLTWVSTTQGVPESPYGITAYNGYVYTIGFNNGVVARYSITNPTTNYSSNFATLNPGCLTGLVCVGDYLYSSNQNNSRIARLNLNNVSDISLSWKPTGSCTYGMVSDGTYIYAATNVKYIRQFDVPFQPVLPSSNFFIDSGNTYTVSSGNLRVFINDPSNITLNNVYYYYSFNGTNYTGTNVIANSITKNATFFVPTTDISNTIYVRASNSVGNSSAANLRVLVYRTPRSPPQVNYQLVGSGNVQVSINESISTPAPYYYLNNVSYHLYAYNTLGGTNLSGNTSTLVYNIPVGVLSNTNSTYGNIVSYVNTGLTANAYTMYVIARNNFGNSTPVSANIVVYTTPVSPTIDISNTQSTTSGNLTVFITDTVNSPTNGVYYLYSMDGITYGNSGVTKTTATTYQFTIKDTGNAQIPLVEGTYTLRVAASNPVGNSISSPATANESVYTTPVSPIIDTVNTQSTTSGNLTVYITDTNNSSTNEVYYLYSMDGITYGNSGVFRGENTTTIFTINNTGNAQVPLTAGTYTLRVAAANSVGNSISSPATATEIVYTTPVSPTIDTVNTQSTTSGNLTVYITDTNNSSTNEVYYLYSMDGITYGNSGVFRGENITTIFTINNTGNAQVPLVAGTYTLRIAAANPLGNSISSPAIAIESVYTIPISPTIDISNTQCTSSGNLTVFITDSSNSPTNGVYYLYSMDGINYGNSGVAKTTATTYQFIINDTGNAEVPLTTGTYTLYIAASNSVGNSISRPSTSVESVYKLTVPFAPNIDQGNTKSITSGNLNVVFTDPSNIANNFVEYTYFIYDLSSVPVILI